MFRISKGTSKSQGATVIRTTGSRTVVNPSSAKPSVHKKIFPLFWKRQKSRQLGRNRSMFSWDEASYECQNSVKIDRIPTAIEYSSSSSNAHSFRNNEELAESLLRYSVPMEIDVQVKPVLDEQVALSRCHSQDDNALDKYSIVEEEFDDDDDDDEGDNSILLGSLDSGSFMSDTALRDEINIEREKIKQSFMIANEKRTPRKHAFCNVSACFGPTNFNIESPTKHTVENWKPIISFN